MYIDLLMYIEIIYGFLFQSASKVIILEKTITYLQQVMAENDNLKKLVNSQDSSHGNHSAVTLQAMENQIAILEKENNFLRKKIIILPNDSSLLLDNSLSDNLVTEESDQSIVPISTTELAELKALELIKRLMDSVVQKHHGQGTGSRILKELSTKKLKIIQHTCFKSDLDQSCTFPSNYGLSDKYNFE